jgi:hypothetical protein
MCFPRPVQSIGMGRRCGFQTLVIWPAKCRTSWLGRCSEKARRVSAGPFKTAFPFGINGLPWILR